MGYYSGNSGSIQFGDAASVDTGADPETGWLDNGPQTKITNWTLSTSSALLDTTTLSDFDKSSVHGIRTTSGTLRLFYYRDPDSNTTHSNRENNSASYFIHAMAGTAVNTSEESVPVRLRLYIDDENRVAGTLPSRDYVEFDANLTSVSYGSNVGELVAVDVSFEATGPLIENRV